MIGIFFLVLSANFLFWIKSDIQKSEVEMFLVSMLIKSVVPKRDKCQSCKY